ncbi:hypothetical protein Emin_0874 [Elusimicrobium minutum Pei191]|uniref:Uncharacterized protein n=1 Tax=Elusimicrobium minutum (strain Pei191) TaxID=445932 RepID=B2KD33_ELUMP|nr:hypothetical protein [Elusimicrobium minutum]ACC98429.1 hypothetical protein Emin_0874 [Elusimicrobium minutum Pei191]
MKLKDLIGHIRGNTLNRFLEQEKLGFELAFVDFFMKERISLESDIIILNSEELSEQPTVIDGIEYIELFPMGELVTVVDDILASSNSLSDNDVAKHFLIYRNNETPGWMIPDGKKDIFLWDGRS